MTKGPMNYGIGTERLRWLSSSRSADEIAVKRLLKSSLDPENLLNLGRVVLCDQAV